MAIANQIRQLRLERKGMSQAQLARQILVSRQTLNAIERGQRLPSLEVAYRIADVLNRDLNDVFHYESELPADEKEDGTLTVTVRWGDDPEWWKSDDVSRVTTRA